MDPDISLSSATADQNSLSRPLSSTSYVYPVRSLLSGHILPANDNQSPPKPQLQKSISTHDILDLLKVEYDSQATLRTSMSNDTVRWTKESSDAGLISPSKENNPSFSLGQGGMQMQRNSASPESSASSASSAWRQRSKSFSLPSDSVSTDKLTSAVKHKRRRRLVKDNFRHFPGEDDPQSIRTFATNPSASPNSSTLSPPEASTMESVGEESDRSLLSDRFLWHASPLPLVARDALAGTSISLLPAANSPPSTATSTWPGLSPTMNHNEQNVASNAVKDFSNMEGPKNRLTVLPNSPPISRNSSPPLRNYSPTLTSSIENPPPEEELPSLLYPEEVSLPYNPSEYGLVHLPPLPLSSSNSERGSSVQSSVFSKSGSNSNSSMARHSSASNPNTSQSMLGSGIGGRSSSTSFNRSSQSQSQTDFSGSANEDSSVTSDEPLVTFRFKHAQDENGHHVIIGREGKLQKCDDEPIRTPGAVQAFGVLVAVDELDDTLVVRQVSENSTELLGLSPRYLFSLECFTDTLPEDQVGVLWDNIQFLSESDPSRADEEENGPHVFLLSGFSESDSGLRDGRDGDRRTWSCWCAVHRSTSTNAEFDASPGLIIMEFELEQDIFNPLYPPLNDPTRRSSSPASPGSSTNGSDQTLVSTRESLTSGSATMVDNLSSSGSSRSPSSAAGERVSQAPWAPTTPPSLSGLDGTDDWSPSAEDIFESTTSRAKPIPALERLRRMTHAEADGSSTPEDPSSSPGMPTSPTVNSNARRLRRRAGRRNGGVGMMDVFAVMAQINEQLGMAPDLDMFLKVVVGVLKDLTQFHRVMVYQFDEVWNGQVVAELLDWSKTHDLFRGLHFPAGDIPAQARELYAINKVRILYNTAQTTARIVVRSKEDLETPLNMTHCYLRAMSPIHIKYLENMGVRASMSVSILAFGQLWGLVTCHSYGNHGMRVSFPVRQMLRLLSQSISRNIERLSYAQRLHTRKLINTLASDRHPTGYIVSNADDLLGLFDADFGILVIGEGAKILGPNQHGQEILIMAEYLRLKQFNTIQASQAVVNDFPDLQLTTGFEVIAGLLYVPLSSGGKDFIAFLRRGQPRNVHWAGKPYKEGHSGQSSLEPRKSFKIWSETVAGRSRAWTDEQLETAGVLALVYGKFIEVWRQKESALQTTKLTNLLLSNASHEVRTPLNHIINYLEMAMNGPLDGETRDNLSRSHAASKSLLFTINDLLDLTRLEVGNETSFNEPFDLHLAIEDATRLYKKEAERRNIQFKLDLKESPARVVGDVKKIRTVVQNLTANALKYTTKGTIDVSCTTFGEPEGLRSPKQTAVEIVVGDTGCGIEPGKLESIFREFEQVESLEPRSNAEAGVGLGLAVVARIVEQLGGQLRVDSEVNKGSRFSFLIPLSLSQSGSNRERSTSPGSSGGSSAMRSRTGSLLSGTGASAEIENLVEALSSNHMVPTLRDSPFEAGEIYLETERSRPVMPMRTASRGILEVTGSQVPLRPVKIEFDMDTPLKSPPLSPGLQTAAAQFALHPPPPLPPPASRPAAVSTMTDPVKLRVLIVEDNDINRTILAKRLTLNGHTVVNTTNGQEGLDKVKTDRSFDAVLMDIQMPILDGFQATQRIRELEKATMHEASAKHGARVSCILNGRIPIFAVSASLQEQQREELSNYGMDGWILKPIDFKRLNVILKGVVDTVQREQDVYQPGCNWESGGWLKERLV